MKSFLLALGLLLGGVGAALSTPPVDDGLLILELRLRHVRLAEALGGVLRGDIVYLPLSELCAALDFPIRVDPGSGAADGWVLGEHRRFVFDPASSVVMTDRGEEPVETTEWFVADGDLYVATHSLSRWLPLDLVPDLPNLSVRVVPREPLPVEQRMEREQRRKRLLRARSGAERPRYPRVETPYRWAGVPYADVHLNAGLRHGDDSSFRQDHSVLASADLLAMTAEGFVAGDSRRPAQTVRLKLGRTDPGGSLLGPVGLTEIALGDVFSPDAPLVARSRPGRGVYLSTRPLDRPGEFDRTTLSGQAQPGWEAELYRNGALLAFQVVGEDGRYLFEEVPVLFGLNDLNVVLYGPQGQRREEPRRLYVGPGQIEPGVTHARLAVNQQHQPLFSMGEGAGEEGTDGRVRWFGEVEHGFGSRLSVGLTGAGVPLAEDAPARRRHYLGLGLQGAVSDVLGTVDAALADGGGFALQAGLRTAWRGWGLFLEHARFFDFVSEQVPDGDPMTQRTRGRVDGIMGLPLPVSLAVEVERELRGSGRAETLVRNRLAASFAGLLASNELTWGAQQPPGADTVHRVAGTTLLSRGAGALGGRASAEYRLHPNPSALGVGVSLDWRTQGNGTVDMELRERFPDTLGLSLGVGWSRRFSSLNLGLRATFREGGEYSLRASAEFAVGPDPARGSWVLSGRSLATRGTASVRVVLDRNGNGRVDGMDTPLSGVRFQLNQRKIPEVRTGEDGCAFLCTLPANRAVALAVDPGSLEDPYWIARPGGVEVLARPGTPVNITFLVLETGEVDGTVFARRGETVRHVPGASLELLDTEDVVLSETVTAFDGFYLFERVPLGVYRVRVKPASLEALGLGEPPATSVALTPQQPVVSSVDWVLEEVPVLDSP